MFYRSPRRPSCMTLTLAARGHGSPATILDISDCGLHVTLREPLPVGTLVTLETPRLRMEGEVRWSRGTHAGVMLREPLSPAQQAELSGGW